MNRELRGISLTGVGGSGSWVLDVLSSEWAELRPPIRGWRTQGWPTEIVDKRIFAPNRYRGNTFIEARCPAKRKPVDLQPVMPRQVPAPAVGARLTTRFPQTASTSTQHPGAISGLHLRTNYPLQSPTRWKCKLIMLQQTPPSNTSVKPHPSHGHCIPRFCRMAEAQLPPESRICPSTREANHRCNSSRSRIAADFQRRASHGPPPLNCRKQLFLIYSFGFCCVTPVSQLPGRFPRPHCPPAERVSRKFVSNLSAEWTLPLMLMRPRKPRPREALYRCAYSHTTR
jgi:hypothetical protein